MRGDDTPALLEEKSKIAWRRTASTRDVDCSWRLMTWPLHRLTPPFAAALVSGSTGAVGFVGDGRGAECAPPGAAASEGVGISPPA